MKNVSSAVFEGMSIIKRSFAFVLIFLISSGSRYAVEDHPVGNKRTCGIMDHDDVIPLVCGLQSSLH